MTSLADSPRIVFIDVDGTIVGEGNVAAESALAAIEAARANGHLLYLCTGRAAGDIHPRVRAVEVDGAITNGGAFATSGDDRVIARPMPFEAVRRVLDFFDAADIHYALQADDEVFVSPGMRSFLDAYYRERLGDASLAPLDLAAVADAADADLTGIAKAVFISPAVGMLERARAMLGSDFHIVQGSVPLPGGSDGEITMAGTTKGSAIELLLDHLGRDAAETIGVGDSWNDVEMFQVVGRAVAMGNAHPELRRLADEVTTDVLDDGVWNAFVGLGLISDRVLAAR